MHLLIFTYYWPPAGGGGVQRWMYFSLYLKSLGHQVSVITVDPKKASYYQIDTNNIEKVKDINTIYTNTLEPLKLFSLLSTGSTDKGIPYGGLGQKKKSLFGKIAAFVRGNFFIPDARKGWVNYAVKAGHQYIKQHQVDCIITTGPPHSTHLLGLKLKQKFNMPWIADFRDPWTDIYYNQDFNKTKWAEQKDKLLEQKVLQSADLILTIGLKMKALLTEKCKTKHDIEVIYNGYDQSLFENIKTQDNPIFTITHIGLLGETQPFEILIHALLLLYSNGFSKPIHINLVGEVAPKHLKTLKEIKVDKITFKHTATIAHQEAIQQMCNADLLLLCPPDIGQTQVMVSTKTMEYLASKKTILGIGDTNSDAALLIHKSKQGAYFIPNEIQKIADFIEQSIFNPKQHIDHNFAFSRKDGALLLDQLLKKHIK